MAIETPQGLLKLISYVGVRRAGRLLIVRYDTPPNPDKPGWWIPAPEAAYGEDPLEVAARELSRLGYDDVMPRVVDVESFPVGERNWHVVVHCLAEVHADPQPGAGIAQWRWCSEAELPEAAEFAHKRWEQALARRLIRFGAA
ncbi:NUDIX hydrolase [Aquincola sp. S2]|uniref:NUDIX hydrolase n=1 Tax=Pseudaquabacterium terrae TaxID=2732868 RepID=A0ABX2EIE6_9BURK|nr:NUDIX domain-containing protein [Aquabacterium terrae]NRF68430.1 NUDIX hydrolase [Aquabacterium terrae]